MTYRGEEDAQRARIAELEREIASKDAEIAVLRGETPPAQPGTTVEHSRIAGGPSKYAREVTLPYTISEEGYEAIAKVLRERLNLNAAQVGRTLTVPGVFALEREGEGTRIRLAADWRGMAAGVVSVGVLTAFFGTLMSAGLLVDIVNHGLGVLHSASVDEAVVVSVLGIATTLTAGASWGTRRRTARAGAKLLADYEGTFAAIVALAEQHAVRDVPKTRVSESVSDAENESEAVSRARSTRRS